ncbi:hypothetical protein RFI_06901 [Reticulomyxa filosa]|uniref:Uncharacterized protein n=1 Tax=Reticulomyxa filosa TaxID=46433 RepID=X6NY47_RETFI|nr:hypothetical protein RFI_06901 [Reticulomyxa filosa]|eukprot:ETO30217.1 hypothetical protein RFI_06901 [Reticulomyxa filosa]
MNKNEDIEQPLMKKLKNHDFSLRYTLESINTSHPKANIHNIPNENTKKRFKFSIRLSVLLPKHLKFFLSIKKRVVKDRQRPKEKNSTEKTLPPEEIEYNEKKSQKIVAEFVRAFPHYKETLSQQFPLEWLAEDKNETTEKERVREVFKFSALSRSQREQLINEIFEKK